MSTAFKNNLIKYLTESLLNEIEEVTTDQIVDLIKDTKGAFFTVTFIKKDGTERTMNCRFGVKKYLRGGDLPYDPVQKGLLPVWDPQAVDKGGDGYRMINVGTIKYAKVNGKEYTVKELKEQIKEEHKILIPRRSKEERKKNHLIATNKKIQQYIKDGSKGDLDLSNTPITSLPQGLTVGGSLYLYNTKITSLPKDLKVGGYLDLHLTPLSQKYTVDQIKQMVPNVKGNIYL